MRVVDAPGRLRHRRAVGRANAHQRIPLRPWQCADRREALDRTRLQQDGHAQSVADADAGVIASGRIH